MLSPFSFSRSFPISCNSAAFKLLLLLLLLPTTLGSLSTAGTADESALYSTERMYRSPLRMTSLTASPYLEWDLIGSVAVWNARRDSSVSVRPRWAARCPATDRVAASHRRSLDSQMKWNFRCVASIPREKERMREREREIEWGIEIERFRHHQVDKQTHRPPVGDRRQTDQPGPRSLRRLRHRHVGTTPGLPTELQALYRSARRRANRGSVSSSRAVRYQIAVLTLSSNWRAAAARGAAVTVG